MFPYGFNSKLVRLKALFTFYEVLDLFPFQFQTGSIKRKPGVHGILGTSAFQFQTGSIKRLFENCISMIHKPYVPCQLNFFGVSFLRDIAVDRGLCKIPRRLTALYGPWREPLFFLKMQADTCSNILSVTEVDSKTPSPT